MSHYDELYPGRFRKGTTIPAPMTVRIVSVGGEQLEGDDGVKAKGVLKYKTREGATEEIVLCKSNAILIAKALGTDDYTQWNGRLITIHHDPNVTIGKERVGGIRVYGSPELARQLKVSVKRPRRKTPDVYDLYPTDNRGNRRTVAARWPEPDQGPPPSPDDGPPPPEDLDRAPGQEG